MARITVEDCILRVPNRFDLVLVAAQRAREISAGAPLAIDRDNDKNPVVALREIAEQAADPDELREDLILGLQKNVEQDEPEDEDPDLLAVGEGLGVLSPDDALTKKSLVEQEISEEVLVVGEEAIEEGADIAEVADVTEEKGGADENTDLGAVEGEKIGKNQD